MDNINNMIEKLNSRFKGALSLSEDGQAICTKGENLLDLLKAVKENFSSSMLIDITAAEYDGRFEVIYHIMTEDGSLIRIKAEVGKDKASIPASSSLWKSADVMEREIYDLMGIEFKGHSNLKRILCPDEFEGHPLRKDFKLVTAERL